MRPTLRWLMLSPLNCRAVPFGAGMSGSQAGTRLQPLHASPLKVTFLLPNSSGRTAAPILQDSSTLRSGCIDPTGNRHFGNVPRKGQAAWDWAVGKAAGLDPHYHSLCCPRVKHRRREAPGSTRKQWGQGNVRCSRAD